MSEHNSEKARSPRPLTRAELDAYSKEFERLGAAFDSLSTALLQAPDNPLLVPELRSAMSRAGWVLTRLLHHGAVSAPSKRPPWLSWRTFRVYRPLFLGLRARPFNSSCFPNNTVLGLVQMMRAGPQVVDKLTTRKPGEDSGAMFIRRHIWVEGVIGWLGQRCTPRTRATAPTVTAVIATGVNHLRDECLVHIVHDWDQDDTKQRLLFVDLARDSAAVSRYLTNELARPHGDPGSNAPVAQGDGLNRASRESTTFLLTEIFDGFLPPNLMEPVLDYLVTKDVITELNGALELSKRPGLLSSYPPDAKRALHNAIIEHAGTSGCPPILSAVIPSIATGGSVSVSQGAGPLPQPRASRIRTGDPHVVERLKWDRQKHVASLAAFGTDAERLFDVIVAAHARQRFSDPAIETGRTDHMHGPKGVQDAEGLVMWLEPASAANVLSTWKPAVDAVATWIENAKSDHTGLGLTPSDHQRINDSWRHEQGAGGRLRSLIALASKAKQVLAPSSDASAAKRILEVLLDRQMPSKVVFCENTGLLTNALTRAASNDVHSVAVTAQPTATKPTPESPTPASMPTTKGRKPATPGSSTRPTADSIDTMAKHLLTVAMEASDAAGAPFVPDRASIAKSVGKELKISIMVESLFGKKVKGGERVYRYPEFMKLWNHTQMASNDNRRAKLSRRSTSE